MNNQLIKIFRFVSGEDIIGSVSLESETDYTIQYPMAISFDNNKNMVGVVSVEYWFSPSIIDEQIVKINKAGVLSTAKPSAQFQEYYKGAIEKLVRNQDVLDEFRDSSLENQEDILIALEEAQGAILH